jgi:ornithine cyclodeaminase/alanine dehydrogenase-like protein (mu-crystallin family)
MLILRPEEVEGLLTMGEAVSAVEGAFGEWGEEAEINATRRRLHTGAARLNTMPGAVPSRGVIGLRMQCELLDVRGGQQFYPSRSPLVDVIFDTKSAAPLALILSSTKRGATQNGLRFTTSDFMTASISAVGTRWMSRVESRTLALLGSGKQARLHLSAMKAIRDLKTVKVYSPNQERRERFAEEMGAALHVEVIDVNTVEEALADADIIVAATNSNVPVVPGGLLSPGVHVTSIVGSNVGMVSAGLISQKRRELDDETIRRADRIGITSRAQAVQDEQGDVFDQVQSGLISWDKVYELRDIVSSRVSGRASPAEITVFKNNGGQGIAELAIADLILSKAREKGLGQEVTWGEGY